MAQGEGFKHITVTAADEEDVIIRVGATTKEVDPEEATIPAGSRAERPSTEATDSTEATTPAGSRAERPSTEVADPAEATTPVGARTARPSTEAASSMRKVPVKKKREEYRETTLEDLQPQPMPLAQKVTIIAAVVCIIGAIIYCVAFLG